ncbi:titin homolog isoform X7 [Drosophila gunungcola]|uniref:titin homolog isoform X7 n=1 Tax=Drosophila gunungcola TaxID=103775 RepID=UPI0022E62801|nr:titin homolog isoform X7 [Drosophila gunungcola]
MVRSISSGVIGEGNWEDNWLFKKKRSSATPSSIGMLVPAPRENVRAQIGDKTTDEVSDLSEMGSDIEESSLDLLRCNDLNDRLLSKHLIGGQNTKLVLDELVDRTSLTSHTLLEEHEPAFTETTNEFVVSPMAVPSDIKAPSRTPPPPPPPMIFQDDLVNEEPDHTPIADPRETEELTSLDGCTGFSTVEYIDEEQMHETVPSVIEILAAMALGPMLAVPASEQPGAMTPSELHTLKELSDLALAEINARSVDLARAHSLDIIEEENSEPLEPALESYFCTEQPPALTATPTPDLNSAEEIVPPPPALELVPEFKSPPPTEVVQETETAFMDSSVTLETELDKVEQSTPAVVDPPSPVQVSQVDSFVVSQTEPVEIFAENQPVEVNIPAPLDPMEPHSKAEVIFLKNPVDVDFHKPIQFVQEAGNDTLENVVDTQTSVLDITPPLDTGTGIEPVTAPTDFQSDLADPPEVAEHAEFATEIQSDKVDRPSEPVEIISEPVTKINPEPSENASKTGCSEVKLPESDENVPETEPLIVDVPAPIEVVPEQQSNEVDLLETIEDFPRIASDIVEIIPQPSTTDLPESVEIVSETICCGHDPSQSVKTVPETQPLVVDLPAPIVIVPEPVAVKLPESVEIVSETGCGVAVKLPESVEIVSETGCDGLDPSQSVETVPATQPLVVDLTAPIPIASEPVAAVLPEPVQIKPEKGCGELDPQQSTETVSETMLFVGDLPAPIEVLTEQQPIAVDQPGTIKDAPQITAETSKAIDIIFETVFFETRLKESAGIVPETQHSAAVDPLTETIPVIPLEPLEDISETLPAHVEFVSQAGSLDVESSTPSQIISTTQEVQETSLVAVDTPVTEEDVSLKESVLVEITSEPVTADLHKPIEIISETGYGEVHPLESAETVPQLQSIEVDPPKTIEDVSQIAFVLLESSQEPVEAALPEPIEIVSDTGCSEVDLPECAETVPETDPYRVDIPAPIGVAPEQQSDEVEPPRIIEGIPQIASVTSEIILETVAAQFPESVKMVSEAECGELDPPQSAETVPLEVDLPAPIAIVPEQQPNADDPPKSIDDFSQIPSVLVENIPEPLVAEFNEPVEIVSETECDELHPPQSAETVSETPPFVVDLPLPVEIDQQQQPISVETPEAIEDIPKTAADIPTAIEIISETVLCELGLPEFAEIIAETQPHAEIDPLTETIGEPEPFEIISETQPVVLQAEHDDVESSKPLQVIPSKVVSSPVEIATTEEVQETNLNTVDTPVTVNDVPHCSVPVEINSEPVTADLSEHNNIISETGCGETNSVALDITVTAENVPQKEPVDTKLPAPLETIILSDEVVAQTDDLIVEPPATVEGFPVVQSMVENPPSELLPEAHCVEIMDPSPEEPESFAVSSPESVEAIIVAQSVAVEKLVPEEMFSKTDCSAVEAMATVEETVSEIQPLVSVGVKLPELLENVPETHGAAEEPSPESEQTTFIDPPEPIECVSQVENDCVNVPTSEEVVSDTHLHEMDSQTSVENAVQAESVPMEPPTHVVKVSQPISPTLPQTVLGTESIDTDSTVLVKDVPQTASVVLSSSPTSEISAETQFTLTPVPLEVVDAPASNILQIELENKESTYMVAQPETPAMPTLAPVEMVQEISPIITTSTALEPLPLEDLPLPSEVVPQLEPADLESLPATEVNAKSVAISNAEVVLETGMVTEKQPDPPDILADTDKESTQAVLSSENVSVESPTPEEIIAFLPKGEREFIVVDPPEAQVVRDLGIDLVQHEKDVPNTKSIDMEPPAQLEMVLGAQLITLDTITSEEVICQELAFSENQTTVAEILSVNTLESEKVPIDHDSVAVELTSPGETFSETESNSVKTNSTGAEFNTASEEIVSKEIVSEPLANAENEPQVKSANVSPPLNMETVPENSLLLDPTASAKIVPETQPSAIGPSESVGKILVAQSICVEMSSEAEPVTMHTRVPEEVVPQTAEVAVALPKFGETVEKKLGNVQSLAALAESIDVELPSREKKIDCIAVDPPASAEILSEIDTSEDPAINTPEPIIELSEKETDNMEVSVPPETLSGTIYLAADSPECWPPALGEVVSEKESPACVKIDPQLQSVSVDSSESLKVIVEADSIAQKPVTPELFATAEVGPEAQVVAMEVDPSDSLDQPATAEPIKKTDFVNEHSPETLKVILMGEPIAVETPMPMELNPEMESVTAEPLNTEKVIPQADTVSENGSDNKDTASKSAPETHSVLGDTPEDVAQGDNVGVSTSDPVPMLPTNLEQSAPLDIVPETQAVTMEIEPKAQAVAMGAEVTVVNLEIQSITEPLKVVPEAETLAVELTAPVEIAKINSEVKPIEMQPPKTDVDNTKPPVSLKMTPVTMEFSPEALTTSAEPLAAIEVIDQAENVTLEFRSSSPEAIPKTDSVAVDSPFLEHIIPERDLVPEPQVDVKTNSETVSAPVDLTAIVQGETTAPVNVLSEDSSIAMDPPDLIDVELNTLLGSQCLSAGPLKPINVEIIPDLQPVEVVPEKQSVKDENEVPAEIDVDAQAAAVVSVEVLPETESCPVLPPIYVDNLEEVEIVAKETPPSAEDISKNDKDCTEAPDNSQSASTERELQSKSEFTSDKSAGGIQRRDSIDSTKSDCSALGSIAEREVKKWYNAVEMPNNPYAPEALKQRISGTQERYMDVPNISPSAEQKALASALTENPEPSTPQTDYKRYSRDYYINNAPIPTDITGSGRAPSSISEPQRAAEDVEDIVINEAQKASEPAPEQEPSQDSVYKALPVQVLDDSLDSQSNPSLHSLQTTTTTTSDESDTVRIYDFNKQETTVIKAAREEQLPSTSTSSSMESAQSASFDSSASKKRERPVVLQFGPGQSAPTIGSPVGTPTRGSTPPAFRFLQPKRRLIDPSQVLSVDEDDVPEPSTPAAEKPAIEDEVVHSMPSVKALAQAFLLTSKHTQPQRRWRATVRIAAPPDTSDKPSSSLGKRNKLEHAVSMAEVADESTIASDLSSLETDPSIHSEGNPPIASPASPVPVRHGFLRSNIAFFENLKFK